VFGIENSVLQFGIGWKVTAITIVRNPIEPGDMIGRKKPAGGDPA
jgi:hypothetical protein